MMCPKKCIEPCETKVTKLPASATFCPSTRLTAWSSRGPANQQLMLTCNRQDFLQLASSRLHEGLVVPVRRRSRQAEIAALLRLLRGAGETGLRHNVNFA